MAAEESASLLLLKCVNEGRVDVLCSILSQLKSQANFHEEVDGILQDGGTLLHHAVQLDSIDAINALLNNGANPCVQNDQGKTAFQMCRSDAAKNAFVQEVLRAITMNNSGRLCQLISAGVPVDSLDSQSTKNTLLNWAADFGTADIVRILCDSGASVSAANSKGDTPLHAALRRSEEEIVRQLLAHGADPNKKNNKGEDAFSIAETKGGTLTSLLSMDIVTRVVRRSASVESLEYDRASILSTETSAANLFAVDKPSFSPGKLDSWTDLLWPQPTQIRIFSNHRSFQIPKDGRLKIYFDDASEGEPRQMMQAIQISAPLLQSCNIELEYRGHKTADHEHSPLDGKVTCGVYNDGRPTGSYCLSIENNGIEIQATDYAGVRYGFATLVQIIRIHLYAYRHNQNKGQSTTSINGNTSSSSLNGSLNSSFSGPNTTEIPDVLLSGDIPALVTRDTPSRTFRAVYQDFSGCRILNTETILQMATRLSYCKANYLFVNFEVRTTDRYQLPYTNRDLFHMLQVCDELYIKLVPSLDLQSSYIDASAARQIIDHFLDDFPLSDTAHFGPNLASILVAHRPVLASIQRRVRHIFLSVNVDERNASHLSKVPPYVTLCIDGKFPFDAEKLLSPRVSIVLKFSVGDEGHLCAAPDSTAKKALLAAKLVDKSQILGNMVCELSTGCEIMPPSLSYMPLLAAVGVSWNAQTDMRKFAFFLPSITAHHFLLDGDMAPLFEQASTLGKVEHTLTRYNLGLWRPQLASSDPDALLKDDMKGKTAISIFVEMILNPENLQLDRLTPAIFKRARMELRRSARALDEARKLLPYNFELALVLAEIRLVTELLSLASRLGQSLCIHSVNNNYGQAESEKKRSNDGPWSIAHMAQNGRVGVSHLPLTIRTDLANTLLSIRTQFQHVWLSRSIPSTLPNALKMFDNLFKALLPPDLHEFGQQLL